MAAPVIYRSTDTSAPVLTGQVGSLITLLDACLVNGYGSKAAAGWSKPYTGTNSADYQQGGSGFYLEVNDNGPGTGGAREARIRGYEVMTAFNTGTGLFPTSAQLSAGDVIRKSATADGTARAWKLFADDRTFYLFILSGDAAGIYISTMFGDIFSYLAGDNYKCAIMGRTTETAAGPPAASTDNFGSNAAFGSSVAGHYIARTYTGFGTSTTIGKSVDAIKSGNTSSGAFVGPVPFPNPIDGGLYISPVTVHEAPVIGIRGVLRGLWQGIHPLASFSDGDTFDGQGTYATRSFEIVKTTTGQTGANQYMVLETTEWDTSP